MWVLGKNIIEKIDKDYNLSLKYTTEIFKNTIKNGYKKLLNFNANQNIVNIVNYKKEFSTLIFYIKLIVIALFMLLCVLFLK
jgi:subtilase family serine protease